MSILKNELSKGTWIETEGTDRTKYYRKGMALLNGKLESILAGLPDTMFSIPAKTKLHTGYVYLEDNVLIFSIEKD